MIFSQFYKKVVGVGMVSMVLAGLLYAESTPGSVLDKQKHTLINPQPEPPGKTKHKLINPQPEPPGKTK